MINSVFFSYISLLIIRIFIFKMFTGVSSYQSERAPLLGNYLQGLQRIDDYTESIGNFYSPMDSPQSMLITESYLCQGII